MYNGVRLVDGPCPANVRRLDVGALPMLMEMHQHGVLIDQGHFKRLQKTLLDKRLLIEERLRQDTGNWSPGGGKPFNPGSPVQVSRLLYDDLRVHADRAGAVKANSTGGLSTEDEYLSLFKDKHPAVRGVLDWRQVRKLETTYAYKLPQMALDQGGRIHTTFKHTRTNTGRYSSEDPNLQNIPTRPAHDGSELGKEIRRGFIASPGWRLVSLDLSQIEMVWAAHLSQDPIMMEVFWKGLDIHNKTAAKIFKLDEAWITRLAKGDAAGILTPEESKAWKIFKTTQRLPCKTLGFGILYGVLAEGLQMQIAAAGGPWWPLEECERLIREWFGVYGGVHEWMQLQFQRAYRYDRVWDAFGRTRLIPGVRSVHPMVRAAALRECGNMPVQGSAGGSLKLGMAFIYGELLPAYREVVRALLTVHDELIFEVREDVADEFAEAGKWAMENVCPLTVPVKSSCDTAHTWGDLK